MNAALRTRPPLRRCAPPLPQFGERGTPDTSTAVLPLSQNWERGSGGEGPHAVREEESES